MVERGTVNEAPETVMANLLAIAEGEDALGAARACQNIEGFNMEAEAKWFAQRGVLGIATAFVYTSGLSSLEQIELTRQLATQATECIQTRKRKFARDATTVARAGIVIRIATAYLDARQIKA
jgi:hypothetical protein